MKHIYTVDLNRDRSTLNPYLSTTLLSSIEKNIWAKKKTIIYLNKRWAYDLLICSECSYLFKCPRCDIALWVHKHPECLKCHHCNFQENISLSCPHCQWTRLKTVWIGTQQIEEVLKKKFPSLNIYRLDGDSVKNKSQKELSLENIKYADIVIGTKMITTWFDLRSVGSIAVVLIEQELQIAKYDTEEKIYQNIKQLIGRWGRVWEETDIILQTLIPNNEMITNITELNYKDFFIKTLHERKMFSYPPFTQMATLRYKHIEKEKSISFTQNLISKLQNLSQEGIEILPVSSVIKRDNQYFSKIIIKWNDVRWFLSKIKRDILSNKDLVVIFE